MFTWRDGTRELVARDGSRLEMDAHQWYGADELTRDLDETVPADLHVPMSDKQVTFRPMGIPERAATSFLRWANTKQGLLTMMSICGVLALWALLTHHLLIGCVWVSVGLVMGAQLYRLENSWPTGEDPDVDGSEPALGT